MKCPHCLTAMHDDKSVQRLGEDAFSDFSLWKRTCPECKRFILSLYQQQDRAPSRAFRSSREILCYPKAPSRTPVPEEVPDGFKSDYHEACLTLADSPKASAALSRRCLQHILRECAKVKQKNLAEEIQQVLDEEKLPSHLLESMDSVRNIGNFAAHPIKSKSSGEVLDVEPGEAEWNLDVLEALFDYFFVQPALLQKKRDTLNTKLREAGKPEMKRPSNKAVGSPKE